MCPMKNWKQSFLIFVIFLKFYFSKFMCQLSAKHSNKYLSVNIMKKIDRKVSVNSCDVVNAITFLFFRYSHVLLTLPAVNFQLFCEFFFSIYVIWINAAQRIFFSIDVIWIEFLLNLLLSWKRGCFLKKVMFLEFFQKRGIRRKKRTCPL